MKDNALPISFFAVNYIQRHSAKLTKFFALILFFNHVFGINTYASENLSSNWQYTLIDPLDVLKIEEKYNYFLVADYRNSLNCEDKLLSNYNDLLTLKDSIHIALCNNTNIKESWSTIQIKAFEFGQSKSLSYPTVTINSALVNDNIQYPSNSYYTSSSLNSTNTNIGINWRLYDFGKSRFEQSSARLSLESAYANHESLLNNILLSLISSYSDALIAQTTLDSKKNFENLTSEILDTTDRRYINGANSQFDVIKASTELIKSRLERIKSNTDYNKAIAELMNLLMLSQDKRPNRLDTNILLGTDQKIDYEHLLDYSATHHPAIRAANLQLESSVDKLNSAISTSFPSLDFDFNYYKNGRPGQSIDPSKPSEKLASITLRIPVFTGFYHTYQIDAEKAKVDKSFMHLLNTKNDITYQISKIRAELDTAYESLLATEELLNLSINVENSILRKIDHSAASTYDLLDARRNSILSKLEHAKALIVMKSAKLRLLILTGFIDQNTIADN